MSRSVDLDPDVRVDRAGLRAGLRRLAAVDGDLAGVLAAHGEPPLWSREPGFPTLVRIILEQQVSLASALAAYGRLEAAAGPLTPASFLRLDDRKLLEIGFSHQKAGYCRGLAAAVDSGALDLEALSGLDTGTARERLLAIRGVGPWSADVYLLMALGRPDVWPAGDLALAKAAREVKSLEATPRPEELAALAEPWRPWRAVAARLLWHHYLETQGNGGS